jgi:penicillin-binding protein 1C
LRLPAQRSKRVVACVTLAAAIAVCAAATWICWPVSQGELTRDAGSGVTIVDRHGLVLRSTRAADGSDARWLSYDQIDPDVINAFIAVEDRRFWDHHGVDLRAVARAIRDDIRSRRVVSGASTISMQLGRLMQPAGRSWGGKASQVLWALRLEAHLGKQQILEQYLNRAELGQGAVGVAAASTLYFGASASELSVGQAALLAGLAHAPSRDNPHVSTRRARARRSLALSRMHHSGFATNDDVARAKQEPLVSVAQTPSFLAPHFTTRVLAWTADSAALSTAPIRTSIDLALQTEVEAEVRHTVDVLHDRGVMDAAVVVLDNRSGEVLAWVGSPDFWNSENGQTDMVVSPRQPGSALKPFLYGMALDRGYTAATVLPDIPRAYATATGPYQPRNYDRRFRGPVRAREALASSYNVPAVNLASRVGTPALLQTLHLAGFESLQRDAEYYGLGLALGNGDVTLIELANGFRALANGGEWRPWTWQATSSAAAGDARDASRRPTQTRRVISPVASAIVLDILQDASARIPGFGLITPFDFPFPVAVKTGTSRHFTDNWSVGTTRNFTVAVWAGNFSGRPMDGVSGVTGAGPLLHRVVMATAQRFPPGVLVTPPEVGAVAAPVCRLSGLRATNECAQLSEWFAPGTVPAQTDDWERAGRVALPDEYADWAVHGLATIAPGATEVTTGLLAQSPVPAHHAPRDSTRARPVVFHVLSPLDGDRYAVPIGVEAKFATIPLRAAGPGAEAVRWSVDGKVYAAERWALVPGAHVIQAVSARRDTVRIRISVDR